MKNERYFYNDPLAAAWMAKHHGMSVYWEDRYGNVGPLNEKLDSILKTPANSAGRYYIHPDSLHLLEPLAGDVAYVREIPGEPESNPALYPIHIDNTKHDIVRIIQRDGKPFFWPESDAA